MSAVRARVSITFTHELSLSDLEQMIARAVNVIRETSRVGDVEVTAEGGVPADVVSGLWIRLEEGSVEAAKNEISIISVTQDPSGLRLASASAEPTLGHVSGNSLRGDGRQEMVAYALFKRWETMRHLGARNLFGSVEFWVRDPRRSLGDDQQFVKGLTIEPDGIHLYMPVHPWAG